MSVTHQKREAAALRAVLEQAEKLLNDINSMRHKMPHSATADGDEDDWFGDFSNGTVDPGAYGEEHYVAWPNLSNSAVALDEAVAKARKLMGQPTAPPAAAATKAVTCKQCGDAVATERDRLCNDCRETLTATA